MWKALLFNPIPKTSVAHFREPLGRELSAKLTEGLFCKYLCFLQSHRHFPRKMSPLVATRSRFGSCVINAIHYQNAASLPLHKGGTVGSPLIRWVTVLFADTVYFTKVDMFDFPCKSNSICKGRAFARYIRLATDSICFATGKT